VRFPPLPRLGRGKQPAIGYIEHPAQFVTASVDAATGQHTRRPGNIRADGEKHRDRSTKTYLTKGPQPNRKQMIQKKR